MPCICGEVTCICFYFCICRSPSCFCQACIILRDSKRQVVIESPSKQIHSPKKSRSRKKSAHSDPTSKQHSPPEQSQLNRSASVFDQREQTPGSTPTIKTPKLPTNDDPHATLKRQLNEPTPSLNYDPHPVLRKQLSEPALLPNNDLHATLRRQVSQPASASNDDQYPTLIKQLNEPCKTNISGNLSEHPSSIFNKNPSRTESSSLSSFSNNNTSLPSTSKTGNFTNNSTKSRSKKKQTTLSDSSNSCGSIEYIKKASDKALPSYESFSSRFTTPSNDENNNRNFELNTSTSQNQDTRQASTDLCSSSAAINTPLYIEISSASSVSLSNNPQSFHSSDNVPLPLSPQEHPLNLSLSAEDKQKISLSQSLELSSRSPSPVPAKQQRMDTMEFPDIPTSECDYRRVSFSAESSNTFFTWHEPLSSDSIAQESYPKTRSDSTASSSGSLYTSCIVRNPSQYTVNTEQYESPMETEDPSKYFDKNITNCPSSAPSTSSYSAPDFSQASASNIITYCNDPNDGRNFIQQTTFSNFHNLEIHNSLSSSADLNRFSETSENPCLEHELFSRSNEQTSSTDRDTVIRYSSSRLPSQSASIFPASQATNPVNISYQAQSHHPSSSTFPLSITSSDVRLLASQPSNESQIASFFQPTLSDVNMVPVFPVATSTESVEIYPRNREHLLHHSYLQSASSAILTGQRPTNYKAEDETDENNYSNRSKRKLS